jgi:hypothetical protein
MLPCCCWPSPRRVYEHLPSAPDRLLGVFGNRDGSIVHRYPVGQSFGPQRPPPTDLDAGPRLDRHPGDNERRPVVRSPELATGARGRSGTFDIASSRSIPRRRQLFVFENLLSWSRHGGGGPGDRMAQTVGALFRNGCYFPGRACNCLLAASIERHPNMTDACPRGAVSCPFWRVAAAPSRELRLFAPVSRASSY